MFAAQPVPPQFTMLGENKEKLIEAQINAPPLMLEDKDKAAEVEEALSCLRLTIPIMRRVQKVFLDEMNRGLAQKPSSLQMENTYLPELPDGTEFGQFLALDLGGTNFRVLLLELSQGAVVNESFKFYHISDEQRVGCGVELFDYLARCVKDFVHLHNLEEVILPMGFTFSFPMTQHSIDSGSLITWTKSFKCSGVEPHKDIVQMLRDSLDKCGVHNVNVVALLNDTTGTLVSGARLDHRTGIAMIIGTGSNACYLERADRVQCWEGGQSAASLSSDHVVIDMEWGAFGDNGTLDFVKTSYDQHVDSLSLITSSFTFEKYISGKYLGEVARCVIEDIIRSGLLFDTQRAASLLIPASFNTASISDIELDNIEGVNWRTKKQLADLNIHDATSDEMEIVKHICALVSYRAAQLLSPCLATLLEHMCWDHVTVAVDGSVYKHHPRLRHLLKNFTSLLAPNNQFTLLLAEDGSGKGAALTAAVAQRLGRRR